jgi:paraquat-inducible protein B
MKNKISPAAIGMFVIAASIIAVAAIMIFGAAKFFAKTETFISFFSESVNGLDVGAPLKYKGVKIGKVEGIFISSSKNIKESSVSVVYSIDIDQLRRKTGTTVKNYDDWIDEQIAEGLRAKLNYQSIVTGMLYIELDFIAEKGDKFELKYGGTRFKEIPAAKTGLSELAKGLEKTMTDIAKIDFTAIGNNLNSALVKVGEKLDTLDTKAISDNKLAKNFRHTFGSCNKRKKYQRLSIFGNVLCDFLQVWVYCRTQVVSRKISHRRFYAFQRNFKRYSFYQNL